MKRLLSGLVVLFFLYWLAALLLLNLADMGLVRSVALALEWPWLEKAVYWFCVPSVVITAVVIAIALIREWIERRRARREAKQIVAQLKSTDPTQKES